MSFETSTQHFDVVGSGYIAEHHAEEMYRHLIEAEKNAVGGAFAWLAFYAIAVVVVVISNFHKVANIVVAVANSARTPFRQGYARIPSLDMPLLEASTDPEAKAA